MIVPQRLYPLVSAIFIVIGSGALLTLTYKIRHYARADHPALLWPICISLGSVGTAEFVFAPLIALHLDHWSGIANLSLMVSYLLTFMFFCSAQVMLLFWKLEYAVAWRRARWRILAYALAALTMIALFVIGRPAQEHLFDFDETYATNPFSGGFLLIYYVGLIVAMATLAYWCWHWAPHVGIWSSYGLRLHTFGAVFGLAFGAIKIAVLIGNWVAYPGWGDTINMVAPFVGLVGTPLVFTGLALPSLGPRVLPHVRSVAERVWRYTVDLTAYYQLSPLWQALKPVDPKMIHEPETVGERIGVRIRLLWRIIEIRDWQRILQPYMSQAAADVADACARDHGLSSEDARHVVEAVLLRAALAARSRGEHAREMAAPDEGTSPVRTRLAIATERRQLVRVARAFSGSPLVTTALNRVAMVSAEPS